MRKIYTLKAGCILIDFNTNKVALIYRKKQNDYEFPKGHLEFNENLMDCAIRETAEETKRDAEIIEGLSPICLKYKNKSNENCKCFYYLAKDKGKSNNQSPDTHDLIWVDKKEVESKLTYKSTRQIWEKAQNRLKNM